MSLSILGGGMAYLATADSGAIATGVSVGVGTSAAMYARLAVGRWPAILQTAGAVVLLSMLTAPPRLVAVVAVTSLAAAELIVRHAHRSAIFRLSAWLASIAGLTTLLGVAAAGSLAPRIAIAECTAAMIGAFLSTPLMMSLAPLAEGLFGHITRLTMTDYLSYEHPLLRELASAAPGTFQHSVNVGVLADAAATAVGADAFVARVGSLYHDVGKTVAPAYFIENQHGRNPHDALDPVDSARILRAHVADGVDLVERSRMGHRIADFVREHHGTGEMRSLRDQPTSAGSAPDEEAFRYPGPKPRSRETAILMIADQLEATARAKVPASDAECDAIVQTTIERIQRERQLENAGLTNADLRLAAAAFSRALQAMYHHRLPYPGTGESSMPAAGARDTVSAGAATKPNHPSR
ncbi:MAG: HDIG domain-containing metalloprotein [Vicinamibacterales bacterium]